ncbi:Domain of uncharacterised function (DUF2431) [Chlamydia trachomatis]|nr:Domain of uncharacterised function (DUF2431) [Chlamydia trachomatis]
MARKLKGKSIQAKGLKGALIRHQHSEKITSKVVKNVEITNQNKMDKLKSMKTSKLARKHNKAHQKEGKSTTKGLMPFNKDGNDKVLLIGEGDFSFAKSLILQNFIQPENLIATSFDSFEQLINKYENVNEIIEELKNMGVIIMHEIDGTNLLKSLKLNPNKLKRNNQNSDVGKVKKLKLFKDYGNVNYIMFNFPHNGKGIKDVDRNIRDHQRLMLLFFENCQQLFDVINTDTISGYNTFNSNNNNNNNNNTSGSSSTGKIIISMFEGEPYHSWGIKILGKSQGWKVERSGKFDWSMFPEYHHRRTTSMKDTTKPANERDARMYIFEKFTKQDTVKQRKRGNGDSDDDDSDSDNDD